MKTYQGTRTKDGRAVVTVDGQDLAPRNDLCNHSPDGLEWGYGGSGPAQLALAILAEHFRGEPGGDETAVDLHQAFKFRTIVGLPRHAWVLTSDQIETVLKELTAQ